MSEKGRAIFIRGGIGIHPIALIPLQGGREDLLHFGEDTACRRSHEFSELSRMPF